MALAAVSCSQSFRDSDLRYKVSGSDVIIDASDLLDDIPRQHLVKDARSLGVDWLYNDFAIQFRTHAGFTISNYFKDIPTRKAESTTSMSGLSAPATGAAPSASGSTTPMWTAASGTQRERY